MSAKWMVYTYDHSVPMPGNDRRRSTDAVRNRKTNLFSASGTWTVAVDTPRLLVRTINDMVQIYIHDELVDESPGRHGPP